LFVGSSTATYENALFGIVALLGNVCEKPGQLAIVVPVAGVICQKSMGVNAVPIVFGRRFTEFGVAAPDGSVSENRRFIVVAGFVGLKRIVPMLPAPIGPRVSAVVVLVLVVSVPLALVAGGGVGVVVTVSGGGEDEPPPHPAIAAAAATATAA
jgi:hypothetical protein